MRAAVFSIGTELTRGEVLNTNAYFLAGELTALGFDVVAMDACDDDDQRIVAWLKRLAELTEVVVCTGGLGPTTDDRTTAMVAQALGVPLVRDPASVDAIEQRFRSIGRVMSPSNLKQADFPKGAQVLPNRLGSAPGFEVRLGQAHCYFLPGVPSEMRALFSEGVRPRIEALAPRQSAQIRLQCFGEAESVIGEKLHGVEDSFTGVTLGYRPHFPEIELKVLARAADLRAAEGLARRAADEVRARLGPIVFAEGQTTYVKTAVARLRAAKKSVAVAESCTGGLVSRLLTEEPASDFYLGSVVSYANTAKAKLLTVPASLIERDGAVSESVARAMAEGIRTTLGADYGLSITGIAGPSGGTPEKPVGLVYVGVAAQGGTTVEKFNFGGERGRIQTFAAYRALSALLAKLA